MTRTSPTRWTVFTAVLLAAALALPAAAPAQEGAAGDEHEHEHGEPLELEWDEFTAVEKARIERLFGLIVCNCPNENWTRSLAGCPDGCSRDQKDEVRAAVKAGKSDGDILAAQVRANGPQVLARPPAEGLAGFWLYALPFILVAAFGMAMLVVLGRAVKPVAVEPPAPAADAAASEEERRIGDEIERELAEMD